MIANTLYEEKISLWNWFWSESRLGSLCLGRICSWLLDHSQEQSTEDAQGLCFVSVSRGLLRTLRQSKFVFPWPSSCWKLFYEAACKASITWRFDFADDLWFPHQYVHPHETAAVWSILWAIICDFFVPFCIFANEDYSISDQDGYKQLGFHLLVLYNIFKSRSVTVLLPYFVWSFINKRPLTFIHHNPKHRFLPLKTSSL